MAHTFQLPIGFQFLRRKVRWFFDEAAVAGWDEHQDGSEDRDRLRMHVPGARLTLSERIDGLPEDLWDALWDQPDEDPAEICSGWRIPIFWFEDGGASVTRPADPWEMRGEFLRVTPNPGEILRFLNSWGAWGSTDQLSRNYSTSARLGEIVGTQKRCVNALSSPAEQWFRGMRWPHSLIAKPGFPPFWISTEGCKTAIETTITVDFLNGVRFAVCERSDCSGTKYFPITSGHTRKYCSQYCGHIESVRRNRLAARKNGTQGLKMERKHGRKVGGK